MNIDTFPLIRPLLYRLDPEVAHGVTLRAGGLLRYGGAAWRLSRAPWIGDVAERPVALGDMTAPNCIGLAAGCDKNAEAIDLFAAMGFGFIEIGTVTPRPQEGNPRPRMFRLRDDHAIINRLGFPSRGANFVREKLEEYNRRTAGWVRRPRIGANIGKNKDTPLDEAARDYVAVVRELGGHVDYLVVNVSSPNTPELRKLQERARLTALLEEIMAHVPNGKPLWVKIAPDLNEGELDDVVDSVLGSGCGGIVATNTTITRPPMRSAVDESGGLSGEPLRVRALEVVRSIAHRVAGRIPVIGVGGISSAEHLVAMRAAGADGIQLYTGLVYKGPALVRELVRAAK